MLQQSAWRDRIDLMLLSAGIGEGESLKGIALSGSALLWEGAPHPVPLGSLVVFVGRRSQVCHQVIFRRWEQGLFWYYLKGSRFGASDGWIPEYRVLGKVVQLGGTAPRRRTLVCFWARNLISEAMSFVFRTAVVRTLGRWRAYFFGEPLFYPWVSKLLSGR